MEQWNSLMSGPSHSCAKYSHASFSRSRRSKRRSLAEAWVERAANMSARCVSSASVLELSPRPSALCRVANMPSARHGPVATPCPSYRTSLEWSVRWRRRPTPMTGGLECTQVQHDVESYCADTLATKAGSGRGRPRHAERWAVTAVITSRPDRHCLTRDSAGALARMYSRTQPDPGSPSPILLQAEARAPAGWHHGPIASSASQSDSRAMYLRLREHTLEYR